MAWNGPQGLATGIANAIRVLGVGSRVPNGPPLVADQYRQGPSPAQLPHLLHLALADQLVVQPSPCACHCFLCPTAPPKPCLALQVDLVASAALPGSTQYSLTLNGCKFVGNSINATGLLAAQDSLDVTLRLLGTGEGPASGQGAAWKVAGHWLGSPRTCP